MVATKILYAIVAVVVLLAFAFLLILNLNKSYDKLTKDSIEGLLDSAQCAVGVLDSECGSIPSESTCLANLKCNWCVGEVNSNKVGTCRLAVCGCGAFYTDSSVSAEVEKDLYSQGDTITVTGKATRRNVADNSGFIVQLSFLDKDKRKTDELGQGGTAVTTDPEGNFKWTYQLPAAKPGKYFVIAQFDKARSLAEFSVSI